MLRMGDISSWNGPPDITSLNADIIAVKFPEATGYVSPVAQKDWHNVKEAKKARIAYHFLHPSVSALAQARFFLDHVKTAGLEDFDVLAVDVEVTDGLKPAEVAACAAAFIHEVQKEGKRAVVVYTFLT